jgi:DNA-binding CsgD family transcriptional regulator
MAGSAFRGSGRRKSERSAPAYDQGVLHGRVLERDRIGALLDAARDSRSGALVLRGDPGIGKSALLEDARERASDMHVLSARGVESESELPFAALHQLLRPALGPLDQLPAAQAEALKGALGLGDGSTHERFLVFAACLSLLSELAERQPVLCLVDDAHWLDSSSADALRFVARRLDAEGIVLLFAAREGEVRAFEAADVPSLQLHGLDAEAAAELLTQRARAPTASTVCDRLVEQTRGNALALIELPAALTDAQLAGDEPLPEALPLTHQLESAFLERVRRLPDETQRLLLVIAADDSEDAALVARAGAKFGVNPDALEAAEQAGLVSVRGTRLEFRHPLVRSAVYGAATSGGRRAAHRALARALADDEEQADRRAWHLASSALEPDEEVVSALEQAAKRAEQRAAYMAAARALERAADLSSDEASRGRRLTGAARCASTAGADEHAVELARRALRLVDDPGQLATLRFVLGLAELRRGRPADAVPLLIQGARELEPADHAAAFELLLWATWAAWQAGDVAAQAETSRLAASFAPAGDDKSAFVANLLGGFAAMLQADTAEATRLLELALDWAATADTAFHVFQAGMGTMWLGDDERFGALLNRAAALARERGQFGMLAEVLGRRAGQLALAQHYDQATQAGLEAIELARELGAENLELLPRTILAFVSALRGEDDEARRQAEDAYERGAAHGFPVPVALAVYTLAVLDLGRGRWTEALERLDALVDESGGSDLFLATIGALDKIEAAVRAGRPEQGQKALALFEGWATQAGAPWAQPRLASCRALLAEGDEATRHFEEALRLRADTRPFDLARIRLLYGEHLRRERRPSDARTHLRAALEGFERFAAEPWAERARAELRATGVTARKRDPSTRGQLTPQELQIARYAAEGLANKEIAAQMFLSKRTIDYHLRNVYAKLGIASRTQLSELRLGDEAPARTPAPASP